MTVSQRYRSRAYDGLGALLSYPDKSFHQHALWWIASVIYLAPDAENDLNDFWQAVRTESCEDLEELYTRTFDNNPDRALEVGWHVFGETYDRGAFLVRMRGLIRDAGLVEGTELPDHLNNLLPVLGRISGEAAADLASTAERAIARISAVLAQDGSPYVGVLDAAWKLVARAASDRQKEIS